jgi:nucleotide-binding universal stress UspA family protein
MSHLPNKILAATDFSKTADKAGRLARDLARRFDAHLHMLHVIVLLDNPHLEKDRRDQLQELLTSGDEARRKVLEEKYEEQHGVDITPHLIRGIAPGEVIVETAGTLGCGLIVMGTHGRRGLSHLLLGSVAERVVRTASSPVLTVRADAVINPQGIQRILVPYDFSEASSASLLYAVTWAEALDAEITLMHVVEPVVYPEFYSVDVLSDDLMGRLVERSKEALGKAAAELPAGLEVKLTVEVGRAADTIHHEADPDSYDLVIMATRGLSGLEHVLLGSVAESVLRRCRVPMLAVPGE